MAPDHEHPNGKESDTWIDRPLIFPGLISHTRLLPQKHSFTYSYLMVGIPILSTLENTTLVSVDAPTWWQRGLLRIEARDHLGRNTGTIRGKLNSYLESQVILLQPERSMSLGLRYPRMADQNYRG